MCHQRKSPSTCRLPPNLVGGIFVRTRPCLEALSSGVGRKLERAPSLETLPSITKLSLSSQKNLENATGASEPCLAFAEALRRTLCRTSKNMQVKNLLPRTVFCRSTSQDPSPKTNNAQNECWEHSALSPFFFPFFLPRWFRPFTIWCPARTKPRVLTMWNLNRKNAWLFFQAFRQVDSRLIFNLDPKCFHVLCALTLKFKGKNISNCLKQANLSGLINSFPHISLPINPKNRFSRKKVYPAKIRILQNKTKGAGLYNIYIYIYTHGHESCANIYIYIYIFIYMLRVMSKRSQKPIRPGLHTPTVPGLRPAKDRHTQAWNRKRAPFAYRLDMRLPDLAELAPRHRPAFCLAKKPSTSTRGCF